MKSRILCAWLFLSGRSSLLAFNSIERGITVEIRFKVAVLVAAFSLILFSADAATWYVDNTATGSHNGTSWANAWTSFSQISGVSAGDTVYISGGPSGSSQTYNISGTWSPAGGSGTNVVTYKIGQDSLHNGTVYFSGTGTWLSGNISSVTISGDAGDGQMHFTIANPSTGVSPYSEAIVGSGGFINDRVSYVNWGQIAAGFDLNPATGPFEIDHVYAYISSASADHFGWGGNGNESVSQFGWYKIHDNVIYVPHQSNGSAAGADAFQMFASGISYYNNFVIGYATGQSNGQHQDGLQTWGSYLQIYNNFFFNLGNSAMFIAPAQSTGQNPSPQTLNYIYIYNNVIESCSENIAIGNNDGAGTMGYLQNVLIANNVVADCANGINLNEANNTWVNDIAVNNVWLNSGSANVNSAITYADNLTKTSSGVSGEYVAYTPFTGSQTTNNYNFHLTASATVMIGQGTNMSQFFNYDKDGNPRPVSVNWDIGPYQYVSGTNYVISASVGTGGSISPSGSVLVSAGNNQTFTITPLGGYLITNVTVDGTNVGAVSTYTFTNVTTNHTIAASFVSTGVTPPSTPASLSASPVSPLEIDLSWTASTPGAYAVAGYYIYVNGATTPTASVTTNFYQGTNLSASTSYSYGVSAYDTQGNQSSQAAVSTTTWPSYSTNFYPGEIVTGNGGNGYVNARPTPGGSPATAMNNGILGTVSGQPAYASAQPYGEYWWWWVNFTNGVSGYVGEGSLIATNGASGPSNPAIQAPGSLTFGTVLVGADPTSSFVVQNIGGGTLSGTASVASPFSIVSGGSYNLTANQSQTVTVAFDATSAGSYNQNVTLTGGGGATVAVSGSATNAPVPAAIQVTPGSLAFATILSGTGKTNSFTVTNVGGGTLSGTASVGTPFSIVSGESYNLSANQSQTVTVSFNPTSAGSYNQNVTLTGGGGASVGLTGSATNAPVLPTVSAISMNVTDVDLNLAGLQIYSGTTVQLSATATNAQTWQWSYAVNGGSPVVYTNSTSPITNISYSFGTNTVGNSYVWTLVVSNGQAWAESQTSLGVEALPNLGGTVTNYIQGPTISAISGTLSGLLTYSTLISGISVTYWYQPLPSIGNTSGGTATYNVTVTNAGSYEVQALVYAPSANANTFLVNFDGQPQNPTMIWDITPLTSGFEERTVGWRGNGSANSNQFVPMVFNLSASPHQLIFVGGDPGTAMASFNLVQVVTTVQSPSQPTAPNGLRILASSP